MLESEIEDPLDADGNRTFSLRVGRIIKGEHRLALTDEEWKQFAKDDDATTFE